MIFIDTLVIGSGTYWLRKKNKQKTLLHAITPQKQTTSTFNKPQKFIKDLFTAVSGEERKQQQHLISSVQEQDVPAFDRQNKRNILISSGAMGLAMMGSIYPAFRIAGGLGVIWLMRPLFKQTWHDLKKRRLTTFVVDSVFIGGLLLSGHIILTALIALLSNLSLRLIKSTEDHSREQLVNVFGGHQQKVWVDKEGVEVEIPFEAIKVGDIVIVNAGESIPVDGRIQEGLATIDQHMLTGESQPVEKSVGDQAFASTLLLSGRIRILVETAGADSVAAQIGNILNNTGSYKDSLTSRGQQIADDLIIPSLLFSGSALLLLGPTAALAVLYIPLGNDMRATGPLTVLNFLQILSRKGILIKDGRVLESLQKVDTIVFDKTGTLTQEQPTVGAIYAFNGLDENTLLWYAAAAEYRQPHPVAKAILTKAQEQQLELPELDEANYEVGYGIKVRVDGKPIHVGSRRFMQRENIELPEDVQTIQTQAENCGYSLIYVAVDGAFGGILELQPTIRPEAVTLIQHLHAQNKQLYIISGDNEQPTRHLAEQLRIDHYFAETLPEHKADLVQKLRDEGRFVCFIGDGINDSIALKTAQVSVSLRGASTAATDTAQIILMNGNLANLHELFAISEEFEHIMHKNFLSAVAPGAVAISGVFLFHFTLIINMWLRYMGMFGGLANTMWPLLKHQKEDAVQDSGNKPQT